MSLDCSNIAKPDDPRFGPDCVNHGWPTDKLSQETRCFRSISRCFYRFLMNSGLLSLQLTVNSRYNPPGFDQRSTRQVTGPVSRQSGQISSGTRCVDSTEILRPNQADSFKELSTRGVSEVIGWLLYPRNRTVRTETRSISETLLSTETKSTSRFCYTFGMKVIESSNTRPFLLPQK